MEQDFYSDFLINFKKVFMRFFLACLTESYSFAVTVKTYDVTSLTRDEVSHGRSRARFKCGWVNVYYC